MDAGTWFAGASASGTTVRIRHDAPEDDPPTKHDQRFWIGEVRLNATYGLSDSLAIDVQAPFRMTHTTVKFRGLSGGPLPPGYESIHHRNETLRGIGDPRVAGRTGASVAGTDLSVQLGLTLPFGRTEENPFALGDAGLRHQHVQFGTGTFNPFVDLHARRRVGPLSVAVSGNALVPWLENEHGYRAGIRAAGGIRASAPAWKKLEPGIRLDVAHEEPERWAGKVQQDGNLGRTDALLGVTVGYPAGSYHVSFDVAVPVWQRIEGGQLEYPAVVGFGISRAFGDESAE